MLIISQRAWSASDTDALAAHIERTMKLVRRRQLDPAVEPLLLLPQAVGADEAPGQGALLAVLGGIASSERVMLAGAAGVTSDDGVVTIGFLLSAEGEPLLTAGKISPDLVTGFGEDSTSALGQPAEFKTASTAIGQVGILPGEDILFAHLARSHHMGRRRDHPQPGGRGQRSPVHLAPQRPQGPRLGKYLLRGRRRGPGRGAPRAEAVPAWSISTARLPTRPGRRTCCFRTSISNGSGAGATTSSPCSPCTCGQTSTPTATSGSAKRVPNPFRNRPGGAKRGSPSASGGWRKTPPRRSPTESNNTT